MTSIQPEFRESFATTHPAHRVGESEGSLEPWRVAPSGGESWRLSGFADIPDPTGAQSLRSVVAQGGVVMAVVVASLVGFGGGVEIRTQPSGARVPISAAPLQTLQRRREDEHPSASVDAVVAESPVAITAAAQVEAVQDALSLPITQIAEIIGVKRATVHNWLREDRPAARSEAAGERLRRLHRLAVAWRDRLQPDARDFVSVPLGDGEPSLVELLRADTWDDAAIAQALTTIEALLEERNENRIIGRSTVVGSAAATEPAAEDADRLEIERLQARESVARARRLFG